VLICPKEAAEAKIDLKDDDPEIVGYLLDYMYQGDYGAACDGSHHRWMQIAWDSDSMEAAGRRKLYKWDNFVYLTTRRLFSEEENGTSKCSRKVSWDIRSEISSLLMNYSVPMVTATSTAANHD
jgi:hypothetical protein